MTEKQQDVTATGVIRQYAALSAGAGLIPVAGLDFVAITALELKMLADMAKVYDVPFNADIVRPVVASLIGAYGSKKLGLGAGGSALKMIPVVGQLLGAVAVPVFAAGLTWAIGRVFMQHFASGGTFLDFDPASVRHHFKTEARASA